MKKFGNILIVICLILLVYGCKKDMSFIPGGEFIMGSNKKDTNDMALEFGIPVPLYKDEYPEHKVMLKGFYIDYHEVTNKEYKKFVDAVDHRPPDHWDGTMYPKGRGEHPVVFVSWHDANDYCKWKKKRLPTEEEWEKAARGTKGLKYPWGNDFDIEAANIFLSSRNKRDTMPVKSFKEGKSPYGLYDMIGNVWEWTDSWYMPYPGNDNPGNSDFGRKFRVTRGQSYMGIGHFPRDEAINLMKVLSRASSRFYDYSTARQPDLGFRCAK
ncbi:MAG: formylglycine-generating enzyme family protein [Nitrospirota bacterium]